MEVKKHVAVVCPGCMEVELVVDGVVSGWTYEVEIIELDRAVEMDENLNYELEDIDVNTVETYWTHNSCDYQYDGDIADLGVVFHVNREGRIVLDKVGGYWKENLGVLKNILSQEFGRVVE